jgi:AraC family transcriptional regulator
MNEYKARINAVIDFIDKNLNRKLTLDELASVANFSKYHFHRIFHALTGEAVFAFIGRLRLERAVYYLLQRPEKSITEIAFDCGYAGSASFSKSFRAYYGISPTGYRKKKEASREDKTDPVFTKTQKESKLGKANGKPGKDNEKPFPYIESRNGVQVYRMQTEEGLRIVEVQELKPLILAYIRYTGRYQGDAELFGRLWAKLLRWAGPRDLVKDDTVYLVLYHDDPGLTDENLLRVTIAMSVDEKTEVSGEVGRMLLEGGRYACAQFRLGPADYAAAWQWIYAEWLPGSGYLPADRPAFERFPEWKADEEGRHRVEICVPVIPAC